MLQLEYYLYESFYMIKNLISFVPEVKENGYLKLNDFISEDEALYFENATVKAFKKAKSNCRPLVFQVRANLMTLYQLTLFYTMFK